MLKYKRKRAGSTHHKEMTYMNDNAIEVRGLVKRYGDVLAVGGIDLDVRRGELLAFLGLNGAGKSTTINIICTLLKKDAGKVRVNGYDADAAPERVRAGIGVVFQSSVLDNMLTVRENLMVRAGLYGMGSGAAKARICELADMLCLGGILGRRYDRLSGGQRRRADIARSLIASPSLLILDEPTTGLDPQTRRTVWDALEELRRTSELTIMLTTHYMEEADRADRVTIIDAGKISAEGTPAQLRTRYSGDYLRVYASRSERLDSLFAARGGVFDAGHYEFRLACSAEAKTLLAEFGGEIDDFEVVKGDMDDVFLNVTGKRLPGGAA